MQNIPRWKKSDRGSSHFRHGLDPRLPCTGCQHGCGNVVTNQNPLAFCKPQSPGQYQTSVKAFSKTVTSHQPQFPW